MDSSAWIAAAALALSAWTLWRQHVTAGRAHLTAKWSGRGAIAITNHGPGAAKRVSARKTGGGVESGLDVPYVGALQSVHLSVVRVLGEGPTISVTLTWSDNRRKKQSLDLELPPPPSSPPRPKGSAVDEAVRKVARDEAQQLLDALEKRVGRAAQRRR